MLNNLTVKANQAVQQTTEAINDVSQGFTQARQEFRDRPVHGSWSRGRIIDLGARYGAYAASGEKFVAKYIVGRGYKATDAVPLSPKTLLKQHGAIGLALRTIFGKLGDISNIAPEKNLAVRLADAAMAAVRFVLIGLPEAALVAFAYVVAAAVQLAYDGGCGAVDAARRANKLVQQTRDGRVAKCNGQLPAALDNFKRESL